MHYPINFSTALYPYCSELLDSYFLLSLFEFFHCPHSWISSFRLGVYGSLPYRYCLFRSAFSEVSNLFCLLIILSIAFSEWLESSFCFLLIPKRPSRVSPLNIFLRCSFPITARIFRLPKTIEFRTSEFLIMSRNASFLFFKFPSFFIWRIKFTYILTNVPKLYGGTGNVPMSKTPVVRNKDI